MTEPLDLRAVEARLKASTPGPWGLYGDPNNPEPRQGRFEAAPGLSIGSIHNTEPIARVSGYMHPVKANAELILNAPTDLVALLAHCRALRAALQADTELLNILASILGEPCSGAADYQRPDCLGLRPKHSPACNAALYVDQAQERAAAVLAQGRDR